MNLRVQEFYKELYIRCANKSNNNNNNIFTENRKTDCGRYKTIFRASCVPFVIWFLYIHLTHIMSLCQINNNYIINRVLALNETLDRSNISLLMILISIYVLVIYLILVTCLLEDPVNPFTTELHFSSIVSVNCTRPQISKNYFVH